MERPEVARGATACPKCGGKLIPIQYGLPDSTACEAAERGEIALGGCLVTGDDARLNCKSCNDDYWILVREWKSNEE